MLPLIEKILNEYYEENFGLVDAQVIDELELDKGNNNTKVDLNNAYRKTTQSITPDTENVDVSITKTANPRYQCTKPYVQNKDNQSERCIVWENNDFNELFNDVHKIVENISASVQNLKVIGFTSTQLREGSSTVLSLISQMISAKQDNYYWSVNNGYKKRSVISSNPFEEIRSNLLIDTQFADPSLHKKFGVEIKPGLYDHLSQGIPLEDVIRNISVSLKLVTLGHKATPYFPKLDVENLRPLLDFVRPHFGYIFLDIPPILHYPEGLSLCKLCDGIVLVVQAGKTRLESVQEAQRSLEKMGVNVIGGILNKRKYYVPEWFYKRL